MSMGKSIEHGKEHCEQYTGSKKYFGSWAKE